jgi:transposase
MSERCRKFDADFKEGAVRPVRETAGRSRRSPDLGIEEGTLGNWVKVDRRRQGNGTGTLSEDEPAELARPREESGELTMERDVLKRSVALWIRDGSAGSRTSGCGFPQVPLYGPS